VKRLAFLPLAALACQPWEPQHEQGWAFLPPAALDGRLVYVERNNARAFVVDPADTAAPPRLVELAPDPVLAVRHRGKDELLVLSRGERGEPGIAPEAAALTVLPATGASTKVPLAARFNALTQSADGRFAVALFTTAATRETLFNPNEVAIIDLKASPPVAVPRTLRSFGSVPSAVVFSPPLPLPDGMRTLAVFLADNFITIVDLDNPRRSEITVALTLPDDRRTLRPVQVVFQTEEPTIYVRADGSSDIYSLRLLPVPAAERADNGNDFRPALSQLAGGTNPADMALFRGSDGPRLLVVSPGSGDASLIDARTGRSTQVPLDAPANRIYLFEGASPADAKTQPRALLLGTNTGSRSISFLDLAELEVQRARNLDSRPMGASAVDVLFLPERGQAVVLHQTQAGQPGMSVVDLNRRTVAPLFAEAQLARLASAPPPSDKLWIAVQGERLGFVTLPTLAPGEVRLDAPIQALFPLPPGRDGKSRLVVTHASAAGHYTVLDADKPERATARSAHGFLLADLLERGDR
jgi:hypothetical protein